MIKPVEACPFKRENCEGCKYLEYDRWETLYGDEVEGHLCSYFDEVGQPKNLNCDFRETCRAICTKVCPYYKEDKDYEALHQPNHDDLYGLRGPEGL